MDIDFARTIFGNEEKSAVMEVLSGHWLASGRHNERFEQEFADLIGVPHALCVNSGSSANLLALASLNLPKGSKVVTSGCGFPATLAPILHLGLEPVLVDYDRATHNIDVQQTIDALPGSSAVIFAHTMGIPVDMDPIIQAAKQHGVVVIEDCCEAIGARYKHQEVGSVGDIGTFSFYPSHQITAGGGGGMVVFKDQRQWERAKSSRDWGKLAVWDKYGKTNTVYSTEVDGIAYFPHYVYSSWGWNFKLPEMCAAFGREQLKRLPDVVQQRKANHDYIEASVSERFQKIAVPDGARPSWFGVILTTEGEIRNELGARLEKAGIRHRPFFAGNITRHPPFAHLKKDLPVADFLMKNSLFVGCYAGLTGAELDYMVNGINRAIRDL